jgi:hypothetical protein
VLESQQTTRIPLTQICSKNPRKKAGVLGFQEAKKTKTRSTSKSEVLEFRIAREEEEKNKHTNGGDWSKL